MSLTKESVPEGPKAKQALPPAVLWSGLALLLVALIGVAIYGARDPRRNSEIRT